MNANGVLRKHWFHVSTHFVLDALLFYFAFLAGVYARFGNEARASIWAYWPFIAFTAVVFSSAAYIFGLYSPQNLNKGFFPRGVTLLYCVAIALSWMIAATYLNLVRPPGRGVTLIGAGFAYGAALFHHAFLLRALRSTRERVLYILSGAFDEAETRVFETFRSAQLELAGVVEHNNYKARGPVRVLGKACDLENIVRREKISRVFCTEHSLADPALCRLFCRLRYAGVTVMQLVNLCEELNQSVPLELVTGEWLLHASAEPHMLYIKKIKRLFDIVVSLLGMVLAFPVLFVSAILIKLTSRGPIFYRQTRLGRFGRTFQIVKLRTMRIDAEKDGVKWCAGKNDPRVTFVGKFLRKYRIDEIPQLLHVFVGDMSFVGPRPERPEMVETLAKEVPFYKERLMVQPGITGWAQVNYPYGASIEDARRKLEYDLYYMKHMSLFLDLFILLDTIRIVLTGGLDAPAPDLSRQEAISQWAREKKRPGEPFEAIPTEAAN